jgi:hypothetical protein
VSFATVGKLIVVGSNVGFVTVFQLSLSIASYISGHVDEKPVFNLLKTKRRLLNLHTQFVPRCKHFNSVTKTNQFMMYVAEVAVCSQINTKHKNTV